MSDVPPPPVRRSEEHVRQIIRHQALVAAVRLHAALVAGGGETTTYKALDTAEIFTRWIEKGER